jgi:hypothetical protein
MRILRRAGALGIAIASLLAAWMIALWLLWQIPGTPHSQIPEVARATDAAKTDAAVYAFLAHGERVHAWNAIVLAITGGVVVGYLSRRWLHLRFAEIGFIVLAVVALKWGDYQPCCVTAWDFIGPALMGTTILLVNGRAPRPVAT